MKKIFIFIIVIFIFSIFLSGQLSCPTVADADNDGWTSNLDCNDNNPSVYPGAREICDSIDNDCDGLLTPCNLSLNFENPNDLNYITLQKLGSGCQDYGIQNGTLTIYCPDNNDSIYWINFDIMNALKVHIIAYLYTDSWNDGGPRMGIDFGEKDVNAWGPLSGYAFFMSDPLDSAQGNRCSNGGDTCPSITKNSKEILALENVRTYPQKTYKLDTLIDTNGLNFKIEVDGSIYNLISTDKEIRSGRLGLHCSEGKCAFDNITIEVE